MLVLMYYSVVVLVGILTGATLWYIDTHWRDDRRPKKSNKD